MKRSVSLFVLALTFTLLPGSASAAKKLCKDTVTINYTEPKLSFKYHWYRAAVRKYGKAYADWNLAINKHQSCKKTLRVTLPGKNPPPKFKCVARARPCIIKTAKKTCYATYVSNFFKFGQGTGKSRKQAKASARIDWSEKVTGLYGKPFSDWKSAKKSQSACFKFSKQCWAAGKPCNIN